MDEVHAYEPDDPGEIGRGELVGENGLVRVVVRSYNPSRAAIMSDERPIKFVPMNDLSLDEDLAVYVPRAMVEYLSQNDLAEAVRALIYVSGATMLDHGPEAVARL